MIIKEMNVSWIMTYVKYIEGEKLKERRMRESKRPRFDGGFSNTRNGHPQQDQQF